MNPEPCFFCFFAGALVLWRSGSLGAIKQSAEVGSDTRVLDRFVSSDDPDDETVLLSESRWLLCLALILPTAIIFHCLQRKNDTYYLLARIALWDKDASTDQPAGLVTQAPCSCFPTVAPEHSVLWIDTEGDLIRNSQSAICSVQRATRSSSVSLSPASSVSHAPRPLLVSPFSAPRQLHVTPLTDQLAAPCADTPLRQPGRLSFFFSSASYLPIGSSELSPAINLPNLHLRADVRPSSQSAHFAISQHHRPGGALYRLPRLLPTTSTSRSADLSDLDRPLVL